MVIVCDFDDTAADQNVAVMLLERFGDGKSPTGHGEDWRRLHRQFLDQRIPLWQYQEHLFSRSHLLGFCRREGIPDQEFSDFYSLIAYLREMHAEGALGLPAPVERLAFD